jgi:hypothetical protein
VQQPVRGERDGGPAARQPGRAGAVGGDLQGRAGAERRPRLQLPFAGARPRQLRDPVAGTEPERRRAPAGHVRHALVRDEHAVGLRGERDAAQARRAADDPPGHGIGIDHGDPQPRGDHHARTGAGEQRADPAGRFGGVQRHVRAARG